MVRSDRAASGLGCGTARPGNRFRTEACVGLYDVHTEMIPKQEPGHLPVGGGGGASGGKAQKETRRGGGRRGGRRRWRWTRRR